MSWLSYIWLLPVGVILGGLGTLVGAGGGFLLVPLLALVYPHDEPDTIASISLAVVCFNATAGTISYARMGRVDYRAGIAFAIATVPGALLGATTTTILPRWAFDLLLGTALLGVSAWLFWKPRATHEADRDAPAAVPATAPNDAATPRPPLRLGMLLSTGVGYISSLLGIGGGIIHVPVLVHLLRFPVHVATATSHFVLAFMAGAGTVVHIFGGGFQHGVRRTIILGLGVVVGAPLGAALSARLHGDWIIRGLALALAVVAVRLLIQVHL